MGANLHFHGGDEPRRTCKQRDRNFIPYYFLSSSVHRRAFGQLRQELRGIEKTLKQRKKN